MRVGRGGVDEMAIVGRRAMTAWLDALARCAGAIQSTPSPTLISSIFIGIRCRRDSFTHSLLPSSFQAAVRPSLRIQSSLAVTSH